jgi:hypothetical protein
VQPVQTVVPGEWAPSVVSAVGEWAPSVASADSDLPYTVVTFSIWVSAHTIIHPLDPTHKAWWTKRM